MSFAYERGWRRSFTWAGFPGEEKESDMAMTFLQPAYGEASWLLSAICFMCSQCGELTLFKGRAGAN